MAPAAPSQRGCSRWSGQDPACPAPSPPPKWLFGPVHIALSISEPGRANVLKVWFRQREARGFPGMEAAAWRPGRRMCGGLRITPALERARWVLCLIGKQMPSTLDAHPPPPSLSSPTMGSPGASSLTASSGRSPVTTPGRGRGTDPTSHPLPSGGPHAARSTSRRRFPALCENVQIVAPSLTLKNVPLFTMLFPLITVGLQEIFLENYFRLAGITVRSQGWKTHLNLFSFYPKKSLSPEGSDEFG